MRIVLAIAAAAGTAGSASAGIDVYAADFSVDGVGLTHDNDNPPPAAPQSFAGPNFTLSYDSTPSTDSTTNSFITAGGALQSRDFGGGHRFESDAIDVSAFPSVDLSLVGDTVGSSVFNNTPTEFFEIFFTLDGGADQVLFSTASDGSLDFADSIDTTGASLLTVGFNTNVNGSGDGFDITSVSVEAIPTPGAIALMGLAGLTGLRRGRRA